MSDTYKATWNPGPPSREFMDDPRFDRGDLDPAHRTIIFAAPIRRRVDHTQSNSREVEGMRVDGSMKSYFSITLAALDVGMRPNILQQAISRQGWSRSRRWVSRRPTVSI